MPPSNPSPLYTPPYSSSSLLYPLSCYSLNFSNIMKNSATIRATAIGELIKGRDFAAQLSMVVKSGGSSMAGGLIEEVMSSISRALDVLDSDKSMKTDRSPASNLVCPDEGKVETCGKKRKNSAVGRGGFRKRKQSSQSRTVMSNRITDDHSWRKYGQKEIHSSKFPRSYFRCTHKYDQGCQATKQVQKSEDDPSLFMITYMGEHSCTNLNIIPNLIIHPNSCEPSIISFGSNTSNITQEFPLPSSSLFTKSQECDEEVLSNLKPDSSDLPKLYEGSMLEPLINESLSEHGDQSSGLHSSSSSFDMSFMMDSFNFDDDLCAFDQGDFFRD